MATWWRVQAYGEKKIEATETAILAAVQAKLEEVKATKAEKKRAGGAAEADGTKKTKKARR